MCVLLIDGDGDLIAGIEYAKENGKNLKVISYKGNTSLFLQMIVSSNSKNLIKYKI